MSSKAEARRIVLEIAEEYGYATDDMDLVGEWNPEVRRRLENAWRKLETKAAHTIQTLAQHIYGSGARFIFELLQNADDNSFKMAERTGSPSFIVFKVHPDRIVVECNEDGFKEHHLRAICDVGKSTKSGCHGYIGAKGIGFKSVFIAAWKVWIQSGHYSFFFQHREADSGLGMVRPHWVDTDEVLDSPLTRMTLYLHNEGAAEDVSHMRDIIFQQLEDLQPQCLMFLSNLKRIRLEFHDDHGNLKSSKEFRKTAIEGHRISIDEISDDSTEVRKYYHVMTHKATGLAPSDNRENDGQGPSTSADVILAFPLTQESYPILEAQKLFAFLPMRESNYKFIIHSDFDTSANREDIVTTSRRNISLLDEIASAFVKAILQFCEHPALCYTWPQFLPPPTDNSSPFWIGLNTRIKILISQTPILRSRHRIELRKLTDLYIIHPDIAGDDGESLFDDSATDPFLSRNYMLLAQSRLKEYGLRNANFSVYLDLVELDLGSADSRMKAGSTTDKWHSKAIKVPIQALEGSWGLVPRMKRLDLLPLQTGEWVSGNRTFVYFPTTRGISIPPGLSLDVLDTKAVSNPDRKRFFLLCGASETTMDVVVKHIVKAIESATISLEYSNAYLRYFYHAYPHLPGPLQSRAKDIPIHSQSGTLRGLFTGEFYLADEHPYGPKALLEPTGESPGFSIQYLHSSYVANPPQGLRIFQANWLDWLVDVVGVRRKLRLFSPRGNQFSGPFNYVLNHRPDKLLGLLEYLWTFEGKEVIKQPQKMLMIQCLPAKELCKFKNHIVLKDTFLPLPQLQDQVRRYAQNTDSFPFLEIKLDPADPAYIKWLFLHTQFNVKKNDDLFFLLCILSYSFQDQGTYNAPDKMKNLFDLYIAIDAKITVSKDWQDERKSLRTEFSKKRLVYFPGSEEQGSSWNFSGDCLWDAPPDMQTKRSLKHAYENVLRGEKMAHVSHLFQQTLSIEPCSWHHIVAELQLLKRANVEDFDRFHALYAWLNETENFRYIEEISQIFEKEGLIFVVKHGKASWHKTSQCLWSSTTEIRGKVVLSDDYEELKSFFVDILGVKSLTLQMVYDELLQTRQDASLKQVSSSIWALNAFLQKEKVHPDPEQFLKAYVFPVTYPNGDRMLRSIATDFAIADRDYLKDHFKEKIKLVDFGLETFRLLEPFFQWANLQHRYLSNLVKEVTSVSDGSRHPISDKNRHLKWKAHPILRIAATFGSPKYQTDPAQLYELLRTSEVIGTDTISSMLIISQDEKPQSVEVESGDVHISDTTSGLVVYVPVNRLRQEFCFGSALPKALAEWLMRDDNNQIQGRLDGEVLSILATVLAVDRLAIGRILDHQGIIQVTVEDLDIQELEKAMTYESEVERHPNSFIGGNTAFAPRNTPSTLPASVREITSETGTPISTPDAGFEISEISVSQALAARSYMSYRPPEGFPQNAFPIPLPPTHIQSEPTIPIRSQASDQDSEYREILNRIITAARRTAFPPLGSFDMSSLLDALPDEVNYVTFDGLDVSNRFRSHNKLERDKKVGAAGELYEFELLSGLRLPDWGLGNWQSTIRKYVKVHPDYADMEAWEKRETSDIVYEDTEGRLTAILIDNNYLNQHDWQHAKPRYYIEVKTTTGPSAAPFYMSHNQYRIMKNIHEKTDRSEIYLILRVFRIKGDKIGMNLYIDLERLKQEDKLRFKETWSVVPGNNAP